MGRRRGFFASLAHAAEQAERAQRRRQREALAQLRAEHRAQLQEKRAAEQTHAESEAALYAKQMQLLLTVHHDATPAIDWCSVAQQPPPVARTPDMKAYEAACRAVELYRPNFFERWLKLTGRRRRLEGKQVASLEALRADSQRAEDDYQKAVEQWKEQTEFAREVLAGSTEAYSAVVDDSACLSELEELGCKVKVSWAGSKLALIELQAKGSDVVPSEEKSLTTRGKLTVKKMAQGKFWETYQDFLCGAALRSARELLAVLPLKGVLVDVYTTLHNLMTGYEDECAVLSVYCPRDAMNKIYFERADPSEVIKCFKHAMEFKRSKGMAAITPINPRELIV